MISNLRTFQFPEGDEWELKRRIVQLWQKALKDSDLEKTKEKSIQGKFLEQFFEKVLGYNTKVEGDSLWTLEQHPPTEVGRTEPDGSLGFYTIAARKTSAVIELKDAKTSLDKKQASRKDNYSPVEQAYSYVTKYDRCDWIIVSNFREIRLYNKNRTSEFYEKFDVLKLDDESEFKKFYYLMCRANLIDKDNQSIIDHLGRNTSKQEEDISKTFYTEYKSLRLKLFGHLCEHNPSVDKKILLEKAQKILDRLIFILFCEDSPYLLPTNLVKATLDRAMQSFLNHDQRVWEEFKGLFQAIDKGNSRIRPPINAYNGGLFAQDLVLDELVILDPMWEELVHLHEYNFESDLNVNILGHIFEQSIADIEQLKAEIDGVEQEKKKSKRKKDGIYYTPEFITQYIVEQTVGRYLSEHPDKLEMVRILDAACGSGAFLNQAHTFLIKQWKIRYEEELIAKESKKISKKGDERQLSIYAQNIAENDRAILLNNLFGVDLNEESVEITKLALWLKTAKQTEPLQNLDNNIKCGNSLIDDISCAGEKAFVWESQFSTIIQEEEGFDIIVGNPPYIYSRDKKFLETEQKYYRSNYSLVQHRLNTYFLFIEKSYSLLKEGGYLGFIVPNTWMTVEAFSGLRRFLLTNTGNLTIINIHDQIFEDANVDTSILIFKKCAPSSIRIGEFENKHIEYIGDFLPEFFISESSIINIAHSRIKCAR